KRIISFPISQIKNQTGHSHKKYQGNKKQSTDKKRKEKNQKWKICLRPCSGKPIFQFLFSFLFSICIAIVKQIRYRSRRKAFFFYNQFVFLPYKRRFCLSSLSLLQISKKDFPFSFRYFKRSRF